MLQDFEVMKFIGAQNYYLTLKNLRFWESMRFTFLFVATVVTIEFILGLGIALLYNRELKGGRILKTIMLAPMMVAPLVTSMLWLYMFHQNVGVINYVLDILFNIKPSWFSSLEYAFWALTIIDIWQWTPFMYLLFLAGLAALPREPFEAALIDGASRVQVFRHLTLPLLRPVIFVAVLLRLMEAFKVFDIIWVTSKGGPGRSTESLTLYIFNVAMKRGSIGEGTAASIVVLFVFMAIFIIYLKFRPR